MTNWRAIACMVAAFGAATSICAQWSFTVDPTFQTQIVQQNVNDLEILEDGKLLLSGRIRFDNDQSDRGSARLHPSGQQDISFNDFTGSGKITTWNDQYYVGTGLVRRLNWDGSLDPSFILMNYSPYFSSLQGGDYHVYPDGRVLMSGSHLLSDSIRGFEGRHQLIWFTNTGYLDTTRTHRTGGSCAVYRFQELPNGQFICSSTCSQFDGHQIDRIFRVHADGGVDTTFRTGVYVGDVGGYLPLEDGRVYVAGNFRRTEAPQDTLRLVRFMPDGSLDPTFSIPQFSLGALQGVFGSYGIGVYPWLDGNLLVVGKFRFVNGQPRQSICMLDTTGAVLPAFAGNGVGPYTYQGITYASIQAVAYDTANAQLYVCGAYNGYTDGTDHPEQRFVTRLNVTEVSTGVQENESSAGLQVYPNPANGQVMLQYQLRGGSGALQLCIRDAQGRVVHTLQAAGEEGQQLWDTRGVAPGIYSVELLKAGKVERTERLVIQP